MAGAEITVSVEEAEQILTWVSTGIINESSGELGIVNLYADGFRAEMMNLHPDVLSVIEINNPYRDSIRGSMPKDAGEWWADIAESIRKAFDDFVASFRELVKFLIEAAVGLILFLIMALVKLALLIYIYFIWTITIAVALAVIGLLSAVFFVLSFIFDIDVSYSINRLEVTGDIELTSGYELGLEYNDFMGFEIPTIEIYFDCAIMGFKYKFSHLVLDFELTHEFNSTSLWNSMANLLWVFKGVGAGMGFSGSLFTWTSIFATLGGYRPSAVKWAVLGLVSVPIYILWTSKEAEKGGYLKEYLAGTGFGFIIGGIAVFKARSFSKAWPNDTWGKVLTIKKVLMGITVITVISKIGHGIWQAFEFLPQDEQNSLILSTVLDLIGGSAGLLSGSYSTTLIWKRSTRSILQLALGFITFAIGIYLLYAANTLEED